MDASTEQPAACHRATWWLPAVIGCAIVACVVWRLVQPTSKELAANLASGLPAPLWLTLLWRLRPVQQWLASVPDAARALLPCSVVLLALGQLIGTSETSYPLAHWHMFSSANPVHRYAFHDVEGITATGRSVRLGPGVLFPSVARHLLLARLQRTFSPVPRPPTSRRMNSTQADKVEQALAAFARRYNRLHPEDPLVRQYLRRVFVHFNASDGTFRIEPVQLMERTVREG